VDIRLGDNQYGKAETRLVRVDRHPDRHEVTDLNVSTSLSGDLAATHLTGDNSGVLPTDTQKNTVYAFARDGVGEIEDFALRLATHFVTSTPTIRRARVRIEQYTWERRGHHSFVRGAGTRTTTATFDGTARTVVSGVDDLVVMNTTGSEFHGFHKDVYTTLPETNDRILATAVTARWRHASADSPDWAESHREATRHLLDAFATRIPCRCNKPCTRWASVPCGTGTSWSRCGWPCRTSTTSWSTCRRSSWTTPARCSTPRTGRTGSSRVRWSGTGRPIPVWPGGDGWTSTNPPQWPKRWR
jgi:urate oxidase